jgi:hypothetical protein
MSNSRVKMKSLIPLNESVNLFTMVDLPVFGLPIIAIIGSRLA